MGRSCRFGSAEASEVESDCPGGRLLCGTCSSLPAAGIDPGGITELVPLVLSSLTAQVTHVRVEEFSDIRTYNAPDVVRHIMLFGGTLEEAMSGPMIGLLTGGFTQSLRMLLDGLGFPADAEIRTDQAVAVATEPLETPIGVIEPGQVAAQRLSGRPSSVTRSWPSWWSTG